MKENKQTKNVKDYTNGYPRWQPWMKESYKILIPDMLPWHFAIIERLLRARATTSKCSKTTAAP